MIESFTTPNGSIMLVLALITASKRSNYGKGDIRHRRSCKLPRRLTLVLKEGSNRLANRTIHEDWKEMLVP